MQLRVGALLGLTTLMIPATVHGDESSEDPPPDEPIAQSSWEASGILTPATTETETEALAQDLALSAEARSWTFDEAKAHWLGGEVVGRLAETIAARWPEIYTGSALSDQPFGVPSIYIKGIAPADVVSLVSTGEVPVAIVGSQPFSFAELEQRKLEVHRALEDMGFDNLATGFDVTARGTIDAGVTRKPGLPEDAESIRSALPGGIRDSVNVTVSDTPVVVDEHAYGGMWMADGGANDCTSGRSVSYRTNNTAARATGVFGSGHSLVMQDDGNLVMYRPPRWYGAVWASNTCCR